MTIKDVSAFGNSYTIDFTDIGTSIGAKDNYKTPYEAQIPGSDNNEFTVSAFANFASNTKPNTMAMTANHLNPSTFSVSGVDGVGKITIEYTSWVAKGSFEVTVGENTQTEAWTENHKDSVFEYVFENDSVTSFSLAPTATTKEGDNSVNRFAVKKITWTTNN